jgi:hypothetical protein
MSMKKNPPPNSKGTHGRDQTSRTSFGPALCVTVVATTEEGTIGALNAASCLATDLDAQITLLKMEVVSSHFPLYRPHVSLNSIIHQQHSLIRRSGTREEDVDVQIRLCRDCDSVLQRLLRRRALVVIGGRRHWWVSGEERLERTLRRLGHHVIFIDVGQKPYRPSDCDRFPISCGGSRRKSREQKDGARFFWGSGDSR